MQKNSFNRVFLVGRLGSKPEGRYTQQGQATSSFSLATHEKWKNKQGTQVEHTEWHNLVVWGPLAEFSTEYLYKGQLVCVEGSLRTRTWEDKNEHKHKTTEILCSNITSLENKPALK